MPKYSNVSIKHLQTAEERKDAIKVRIAVFVDEQKYSLESELDRYNFLDKNLFKHCKHLSNQTKTNTVTMMYLNIGLPIATKKAGMEL